MPHRDTPLVFASGDPDSVDPVRIKVPGYGAAVVAFANAEVAVRFGQQAGFTPRLLQPSEVPREIADDELLVFESMQAVDDAYKDQATYDFARLLRPWIRNK